MLTISAKSTADSFRSLLGSVRDCVMRVPRPMLKSSLNAALATTSDISPEESLGRVPILGKFSIFERSEQYPSQYIKSTRTFCPRYAG